MSKITNILEHFPKNYTPSEEQQRVLLSIEDAILRGDKFIVLSAPTGFGKSFVPATLANMAPAVKEVDDFVNALTNYDAFKMDSDASGRKYKYAGQMMELPAAGAFTLTVSKALQDQYLNLFQENLQILKGKKNYQCAVDDNFDTELAPCMASRKLLEECWAKCRCPYYEQRKNALIAQHGVLNYSMYMVLPDHVKRRKILICDEASELEEELIKHFSIQIDYAKLKFLDIKHTKLHTENPKAVFAWLNDLWVNINARNTQLIDDLKNDGMTKADAGRALACNMLEASVCKVLGGWDKAEYVVEYDSKGVSLVPLRVNQLSDAIFSLADHVVLMSATIIDHKNYTKSLGIKNYCFIEAKSSFDPKKSPIYIMKGTPLGHANMATNLPRVVDAAKALSEHHKGQKGIIHTHSFVITQALQNKLTSNRFLYREDGASNESIIREHSIRTDDTVLVSPSLTMGVDLKGDLGQWQIITKLPYAPLGNKRIKKLFETDKEWYVRQMLSQLVQASGRCTRNASDEAVTYIMDSNAIRVIQEYKHLLPRHFLDRIK